MGRSYCFIAPVVSDISTKINKNVCKKGVKEDVYSRKGTVIDGDSCNFN